jgi:hypothetical protein
MAKKELIEGKYYEDDNGGLHGNDDFMTPLGFCGYVNLTTESKFGKREINVLFDKDIEGDAKAQLKALQTGAQEICEAFCKKEYAKEKEKLGAKFKTPLADFTNEIIGKFKRNIFRDGDRTGIEAYADRWYIVAKAKKLEDITIIGGEASEFKPGAKIRAQVRIFVGVDGFAYKLTGLKFVAEGEEFKLGGGNVDGASLLRAADDAAEAVKSNVNSSVEEDEDSGDIGDSLDKAVAATTSKGKGKAAKENPLSVL